MAPASTSPTTPAAAPSPARRVTLKDIARALHVSPATVSNAYNRPDQLSPQLRARILETAQALGYSGPDPLASSLRRGRAGAVGVVYDATLSYAFADPAASLFLGGLARALEPQGLGLLLIPNPHLPPAPDDTAPQAAPLGRVQSASVDGFIVYSASDGSDLLRTVVGRGLPTVLVDQSPMPGAAHIGIDDAGGAREAARHLLDLGHRHVGVLSLEFGPSVTPAPGAGAPRGTATPEREAAITYRTTAQRLGAYRDVAGQQGGVTLYVMEAQDNTPQEGERMARELLQLHPGITGLLCMSDVLAQGALGAARHLGLAVPGDLSVVGYDDVPSSAALGLSSVHQPTAQKGELAGRVLLEVLNGGPPRELVLPTVLVPRESSGPVRTG
ncbi:LacI family DNA-binding transcriptional regulator [Deinococcus aquiradiocola]|uniref:Transcriptional regulator n=1 Tax=Deinococcus aquiradiocola TaxID=393059 RepID=A0A917PM58_9DEIO|nr:LacI family DNA-binding transcriptional regulator [Deinococcus aquiradiocola]GGJ83940.1 transcriptional regulator [Deinococcus aquiradiocola]